MTNHLSTRRILLGCLAMTMPVMSLAMVYEYVDLGPAPNVSTSTAQSINDSGAIVFSGIYVLPSVGGSLTTIPPFAGSTRGPTGSAINNAGFVVGDLRTTTAASTGRAFRYDPNTGVTTNLGGIGERSDAVDINASGDAVGFGRSTSSSASQRALLYTASGTVVNLATTGFITTESSSAVGISNTGQIIGSGRLTGSTNTQALVFNGSGGAIALPILAGDLSGRARGINNLNRVVGDSSGLTANLQKAVEWDLTLNTITQYASPASIGGGYVANRINDSGVAIGSAIRLGTLGVGVIYISGAGFDIASRVVNPPLTLERYSLVDINSAGDIVGQTSPATTARAFLLRPVTNFATVELTVNLLDLTPGPFQREVVVTILQNGNEIQRRRLGLSQTGSTSFVTNLSGTFDVRIKGDNTWLSKVITGVNFTTGATTTMSASLLNGDVTGDNEVGPADFSALAASFGLFNTDLGFNVEADLNKDLEVGPADFSILAASFGEFGE